MQIPRIISESKNRFDIVHYHEKSAKNVSFAEVEKDFLLMKKFNKDEKFRQRNFVPTKNFCQN